MRHERNVRLLAQKFVSQAAVDQSETEYKAAQAQLAAIKASAGQATATRGFNTIAAPYAGVVGATHVELGDMAQPGRTLVTLFVVPSFYMLIARGDAVAAAVPEAEGEALAV
jgi:multidrug resistance efflux pump